MNGHILKLINKRVAAPKFGFHSSSLKNKTGLYDLIVVGGGIVGCATAREMKLRNPNLRIALVEKENDLAMHQTGHNSGVIHAGIYYKPGSMKAKLCVEGLKMSYEYLNKHDIPYKKVGKLVVAHGDQQVKQINELFERSQKNSCPDIKLVDKESISNYERKCKGDKALWSPWTGIVDWAHVCRHFAEEFKKMGGKVYLNFEVAQFSESTESKKGSTELLPIKIISKGNKELRAKNVITCAGLHSDRVAAMTGCDKDPCIVPFRGEYLLLNPEKKDMITTNIYPVPDPRFPFLGVHFTPRVNGDIWLGPNAVLALAREGYNWSDINLKDIYEMLMYPGFRKMCLKYIRPGIVEMYKSFVWDETVKESQKFIPEVGKSDLRAGPAGVRAQALDINGNLVDDFIFDSGRGSLAKRIIHCRNVPSPAATSSMAIAKYIVDKMDKDFEF